MNAFLFNRKNLTAGLILAFALNVNAQVKSTHTDEKYGNTTVVYKDTTATDADVLNALGNEFGMGDVIRVTVAPPKPAPAPLIDKSKGEDVWLTSSRKPEVKNLSASSSNMPVINQVNKPVTAPAAPVARPIPAANPPANAAIFTNAANAAPNTESVNTAERPAVENAANAAVKTKSASGKSVKSAQKPSHKSGRGYGKAKSHKSSRRHFSCPKF